MLFRLIRASSSLSGSTSYW